MSHYNPFFQHHAARCYPTRSALRDARFLEIGPGNGDFLLNCAKQGQSPLVAIEIKATRYEKIRRRIERARPNDLMLVHGDARGVLSTLFRPEQFEHIYILFLDPWPKTRHAKHRLFHPFFIHDLYRILKKSGSVVLAHDDPNYLNSGRKLLLQHPGFQEKLLSPDLHNQLFRTYYAKKWQQQGRSLQACQMSKTSLSFWDEFTAASESGWWRYQQERLGFRHEDDHSR